jgi:hypothetical protein
MRALADLPLLLDGNTVRQNRLSWTSQSTLGLLCSEWLQMELFLVRKAEVFSLSCFLLRAEGASDMACRAPAGVPFFIRAVESLADDD